MKNVLIIGAALGILYFVFRKQDDGSVSPPGDPASPPVISDAVKNILMANTIPQNANTGVAPPKISMPAPPPTPVSVQLKPVIVQAIPAQSVPQVNATNMNTVKTVPTEQTLVVSRKPVSSFMVSTNSLLFN